MTYKRIQELADFLYSSNDINDVPLRIAVVSGQFAGHNLSKKQFVELMIILKTSKNLKQDLRNFWDGLDDYEE